MRRKNYLGWLAMLAWAGGALGGAALAEEVNFIVAGDSRDGVNPAPVLSQIMREVKLLGPDFMVHAGDWVGAPSKEGWANFLRVMESGGVPFYLTVGNHETTGDWATWQALYQEMIKKPLYYSFKRQNCCFIVLCCYAEEKGQTVGGKIDERQFGWLEKELEQAQACDFIFIFVHEPLYPVDGHVGDSLDSRPAERDKLAGLLRKYKEKVIVFCAHEHLYHKQVVEGLTQIITGGAGAPLYTEAAKGGLEHYLYCTVAGQELKLRVIRPGGIYGAELLADPWYARKLEYEKQKTDALLPLAAAAGPPAIDGNLADWTKIKSFALMSAYALPDDLSAEVFLGWDAKGLYFAARVRDNTHQNRKTGQDIWDGDAIQLAFDTKGDAQQSGYGPDDYEFGLALTSTGAQCYCWQAPAQGKTGLRADIPLVIKRDGGVTLYEAFFPAAELGPLALKPGGIFGFSCAILDDDTGAGSKGCLELSPGILHGKNPTLFKKIILLEK